MPGKRSNTGPAWTKPPIWPTVEECDKALKDRGLTRTEQNYWLDARNEAMHTAELNARLEARRAKAA